MSVVFQKSEQSDNLSLKAPSRVVDTRGQACPYPMIETRKAISVLQIGEVLEIVTDIEGTATTSIPLVCETFNCDYVVLRDGDRWLVRIRK
jgi:TusA-related sulfurtransferase